MVGVSPDPTPISVRLGCICPVPRWGGDGQQHHSSREPGGIRTPNCTAQPNGLTLYPSQTSVMEDAGPAGHADVYISAAPTCGGWPSTGHPYMPDESLS
jgi:hypothetical protein